MIVKHIQVQSQYLSHILLEVLLLLYVQVANTLHHYGSQAVLQFSSHIGAHRTTNSPSKINK